MTESSSNSRYQQILKVVTEDREFNHLLMELGKLKDAYNRDFDKELSKIVSDAIKRLAIKVGEYIELPVYTAYHPFSTDPFSTDQKLRSRISCHQNASQGKEAQEFVHGPTKEPAKTILKKIRRYVQLDKNWNFIKGLNEKEMNLFNELVKQSESSGSGRFRGFYLPMTENTESSREVIKENLDSIAIQYVKPEEIFKSQESNIVKKYMDFHYGILEAAEGGMLIASVNDPFNAYGLGCLIVYGYSEEKILPNKTTEIVDIIDIANRAFYAIREREMIARARRHAAAHATAEKEALLGAWALHELRNQGSMVQQLAENIITRIQKYIDTQSGNNGTGTVQFLNDLKDKGPVQTLKDVGAYLGHLEPSGGKNTLTNSDLESRLRQAVTALLVQYRGYYLTEPNNNTPSSSENIDISIDPECIVVKSLNSREDQNCITDFYRACVEIIRNGAKNRAQEFKIKSENGHLRFEIVPESSMTHETEKQYQSSLKKAIKAWNEDSANRRAGIELAKRGLSIIGMKAEAKCKENQLSIHIKPVKPKV